jgi:regulator of cell morphogenesis and NO signaling
LEDLTMTAIDATMTRPHATRTLGALAVELPGATAVFRRYRLDFCCGGQQTLAEACAGKGLDAQAVLAELDALDRGAPPEAPEETGALIDHLLSHYHEVHRRQLPELQRMARRVEAVHRDHPQVPIGLTALLESIEAEMLEHMAKEEQILFPLLRAGGHPGVVHPIAVMRHEHDAHGERLRALLDLTADFTPPADACTTWRALYAAGRQFVDDLMQHIHLENNLLFPPFEAGADR